MTSQPNPFASHWLIRDIVISSHKAAVGPGGLLFIGDSIVEGFYWNRIGSLPVINAGYSGIWTEALEPRVPLLLQSAQPRIAVLLVGANDAKKDCAVSDLDDAAAHFERIIGHFGDAEVPVVVLTPPPIEQEKRLTGFYSPDAMASLCGRILRIAEGRAAGSVDLQNAFAGENGMAREGMTTDGIHLSAQSYRLLHHMLEHEVAKLVPERDDR
ncbi:SGNH/GDSL hydrolase family protein [Microvirga lotononidis]|uniref:Lysophospholipase L1-like esterase n=1 Tax=Microvirga lotononidis TaxID=864069 RepID=I4YL84_9HYPH|nr:SGNH/GDSL hydrolase family protein [Microvirga lotononidis]EIM24726.1 lysophospholipase L1-like esterase [Microvirga lotononidis]WQO26733.1 SGNH/GDSL hydrolase family protein [Microvirga lotononidis]